MHAGRVLAEGSPDELIASSGAASLEDAFISILKAAEPPAPVVAPEVNVGAAHHDSGGSLGRILAYARRETVEVLRDRVRLAFAFLGSAILMLVFCFGITLDIDELDSCSAGSVARSRKPRLYVRDIRVPVFQPNRTLAKRRRRAEQAGVRRSVSGNRASA